MLFVQLAMTFYLRSGIFYYARYLYANSVNIDPD